MSVEVLVIENLGQKKCTVYSHKFSLSLLFFTRQMQNLIYSCTILNSYGRDIFVKLGYDLQSKGVLATKRGP